LALSRFRINQELNAFSDDARFFTNCGSRRDITVIVRRCAEATELNEGHFMERRAGTPG